MQHILEGNTQVYSLSQTRWSGYLWQREEQEADGIRGDELEASGFRVNSEIHVSGAGQ